MKGPLLTRLGMSVGALVTATIVVLLMLWSAYSMLEMEWLAEPFKAVVRTFVRMFGWGIV